MYIVDWPLLLEYLKVLFSWPPILALTLIWFVRRFTKEIAELIAKIKQFSLPGGSTVTISAREESQQAVEAPAIYLPTASNTGHTNLTAPSAALNATEGQTIDRTISARVNALYPRDDPYPPMEFMHLNPGPAMGEYVEKVFHLHCERSFNLIFGTQVSVLAFLDNPFLNTPSSLASFEPLFDQHQALSGGSPRTIAEFMKFLSVSGFVENVGNEEDPLFQITFAGREFLAYIRRFYPLIWNTRTF